MKKYLQTCKLQYFSFSKDPYGLTSDKYRSSHKNIICNWRLLYLMRGVLPPRDPVRDERKRILFGIHQLRTLPQGRNSPNSHENLIRILLPVSTTPLFCVYSRWIFLTASKIGE
jgi:hypothetical protein